ncbi:MAG TPA: DUF2946 family protein [Rhizomicrobium sp.]|nr:DUF2946 family protein [Rhizomicrobium sp.]
MRFGSQIVGGGAKPVWRLGVILFTLLAFAFQSFTTQTHIHKLSLSGIAGIAAALDIDAPSKNGKPPTKQDQNCPLCQAVAHAGAFVSPSSAVSIVPTLSVQIIAISPDVAIAIDAVSHSWQSRGPPLG